MSAKSGITTLFILCLSVSCGLKRAPTPPKSNNLPSITERYQYKLPKASQKTSRKESVKSSETSEKEKSDLEQVKKN